MILMSLWNCLSVFRLSHCEILGLTSLKFKPNRKNILEFNLIIIIKILEQVINKFSKILQNKK
jgi:hypothetical protein